MRPTRSDYTLCTEALLNLLCDTVTINDSCQVIHDYVVAMRCTWVASGVEYRGWASYKCHKTSSCQTSRLLLRKQTSGCVSQPGGDTYFLRFGDQARYVQSSNVQ
jgi:hypothetical protein